MIDFIVSYEKLCSSISSKMRICFFILLGIFNFTLMGCLGGVDSPSSTDEQKGASPPPINTLNLDGTWEATTDQQRLYVFFERTSDRIELIIRTTKKEADVLLEHKASNTVKAEKIILTIDPNSGILSFTQVKFKNIKDPKTKMKKVNRRLNSKEKEHAYSFNLVNNDELKLQQVGSSDIICFKRKAAAVDPAAVKVAEAEEANEEEAFTDEGSLPKVIN